MKLQRQMDEINSSNMKYVTVTNVWKSNSGGSGVFKRRKQQVCNTHTLKNSEKRTSTAEAREATDHD